MTYDIEEIRQSPRQFVDLPTVERLSDRVMILEQQLATKDALLVKARNLLDRLDRADDLRDFMSVQQIVAVKETIAEINKELK